MAVTLIKFDTRFNASFYTGMPTAVLTPGVYPIALDGRNYHVEWEKDAIEVWGAKYKRESLPMLRTQADTSAQPGAQSLSPQNFWPRSQESWASGSGQAKLDRTSGSKPSVDSRFNTSKGINPWTAYQLSLLNGTSKKLTSANTGLLMCVAGINVYIIDGTALKFSADLITWTTVTGTPNQATSICTDGSTVYTAHGASGVYSTATGAASTASYATGTVSLVGFAVGRLMAAGGTSVYNITAGGALPAALLTKGTGWKWVEFTGGQTQIFVAGYSGDKSLIYRIAILADGTALTAPTVAGELPDGEIIRSINAYLGFVVLGTDLGVRFAAVDSSGNLTMGALIPTASPVYCSEGHDRFIWYGLTNYDTVSTGLGRMDLTTFTSILTPAYASDLMTTAQGLVKSVKSFNNLRLFTVEGVGLFTETSVPVSSGTLTTGWVGYGISDPKIAVFVDITHESLNGTISISLAADTSAAVVLGTSAAQGTVAPSAAMQCNQVSGIEFQITATLTPTANVSPILTRWTLRSFPTPHRSTQFMVPIMLDTMLTMGDTDFDMNIKSEYALLEALYKTQRIVNYQEGNNTYQVIMSDFRWLPKMLTLSGDMSGIFLAYLNEITG